MNKKALLVISTDWHLKKENIPQIIDLVNQKCELAKSLGIKYLLCLGDIFDSRIAQREDVLTAFGEILDNIESYGLELWAIPGNHDKTVYTKINSFLHPFKGRKCFHLIDRCGGIPFNSYGINIHMIPFFEEEVWLNEFHSFAGDYIDINNSNESVKHILCTHIAVTGSRNNDGTMVSSVLSTKLFKGFYKVLSGHYHNMQTIGENFFHLPSIQQNDFGENADKGFTILYSDGSHELVKSKFTEFIKIQIDLDKVDNDSIENYKRKFKNNENNIRFEFTGNEEALKSIRKEDFIQLGIDVKTKNKEIEDDIIFSESAEVIEHNSQSIIEEFKKCCEKEGWNVEDGLVYLNKTLKNGSK